jgi:hypothetical protein
MAAVVSRESSCFSPGFMPRRTQVERHRLRATASGKFSRSCRAQPVLNLSHHFKMDCGRSCDSRFPEMEVRVGGLHPLHVVPALVAVWKLSSITVCRSASAALRVSVPAAAVSTACVCQRRRMCVCLGACSQSRPAPRVGSMVRSSPILVLLCCTCGARVCDATHGAALEC